jgi:predicted amidophosphoribosyltransferase
MTSPRTRHDGSDGAGNLICPSCDKPRTAGQYLCPACWFALPTHTRNSLNKRDHLALTRLRELVDQLGDGDWVPLDRIKVTP